MQPMINALLDPVVNFGKVTVLGGHTDNIGDNVVTLIAGDGSKLPNPDPSGSFNLVWFNNSTYSDPADDPNVEIVRCMARVDDTLWLIRAQEGTPASAKNIPTKIYKMILSPTKKTITDIQVEYQSGVSTHSALSTGVHGIGVDTIDGVNARNIAISTHSLTTSNVHGFDALGDAPAQTHGISRHTGTIGTWANIDKTTSSIADITAKSHTLLTDIGTNTHTIIDTHIAATGTSVHGLGTMSTQAANAVAITGGTITGLTSLTIVSGTPTAPTAAISTNTTQIATTAFVNSEIANDTPTKTGIGASGTWGINITGSSASCTGNAATATNADQLDGSHRDVTYNSFGNGTIPMRNPTGYLFSNYFNCTADVTATTPSHFAIQTGSDSYIRWQTLADVQTALGIGGGGGNLLASITPSITGIWNTNPGTNAQMSDEDVDSNLTTAGYQTSTGGQKNGYVTWDLGSLKRISVWAMVTPSNSSAYYDVSRDNTNWHSFGGVGAGNTAISSTSGYWRYIRINCSNNSNTTSYTKIKAGAYQL